MHGKKNTLTLKIKRQKLGIGSGKIFQLKCRQDNDRPKSSRVKESSKTDCGMKRKTMGLI